MAGLSGSINAADGAAFDQRLDALAATVCEHDPRSAQQRRADATGVLGRGEATLACQCGLDDCPAKTERNAAAAAVIHVLAEQATLESTSDKPGYLPGFGILPAESVRDLVPTAQLKPLIIPSETPDPGYRPSAVTREFVRWRDLTCRWPGCDRPVHKCDIDHTVPYPDGLTHASDLKHYCRIHHLFQTFDRLQCGSPRGSQKCSSRLLKPVGLGAPNLHLAANRWGSRSKKEKVGFEMGTHEAQRAMRARKAAGAAVLAGGMLLAAPGGIAIAAPDTGPGSATTGPGAPQPIGVHVKIVPFKVKIDPPKIVPFTVKIDPPKIVPFTVKIDPPKIVPFTVKIDPPKIVVAHPPASQTG
jgi:Domain of unknown function (DUF222)